MKKEYLKISYSVSGSFITEIKEFCLDDLLIDDMFVGDFFKIEKIEMEEEQYYNLPEFEGF